MHGPPIFVSAVMIPLSGSAVKALPYEEPESARCARELGCVIEVAGPRSCRPPRAGWKLMGRERVGVLLLAEGQDDACRGPDIVLACAQEAGEQVISLNDTDRDHVAHFNVYGASEAHAKAGG